MEDLDTDGKGTGNRGDNTSQKDSIETTHPQLDPESFCIDRLWGGRPDGIAINELY